MEANNYTLGKRYTLRSKTQIDDLFVGGNSLKSYPYLVTYKYAELEDVPFKFVISAPKKIFKKAHERNRAKRICREAIRLNKHDFESYLSKKNIQLALFVMYSSKEEMEFKLLQKKTAKLFNNIIKHIEENVPSN